MRDVGVPDDYAGFDGENPDHLGLCYEQLTGMLVAAYQRQEQRIDALERKLKAIERSMPNGIPD